MKHEIEIEGLPEGWEPVAFRPNKDEEFFMGSSGRPEALDTGTNIPRLIVRRKTRKYDWSKTLEDVLVKDGNGRLMPFSACNHPTKWLSELWQPNIHGTCPVDPEASMVRLKHSSGEVTDEVIAKHVHWRLDGTYGAVLAWQFIRLSDGYEW